MPKFALRNYSFVLAAENQRCILTYLLLPPINIAGFLAALPGSCEDNADLGKQPFFCCLLVEMAKLQKPQLMEYHKDLPTKQIYDKFQCWLLLFQVTDISLNALNRIEDKIYLFPISASPSMTPSKSKRTSVHAQLE